MTIRKTVRIWFEDGEVMVVSGVRQIIKLPLAIYLFTAHGDISMDAVSVRQIEVLSER